MSRNLLAVAVLFASAVCAAEQAGTWSKRIAEADAAYDLVATKLQNDEFYAAQKVNAERRKANTIRLAALEHAMKDATKAGDLTAANAIKARLDDATKAAEPVVPNPADAVRGRPFFLTALYGCEQSWTDITDDMNRMARTTKVIRLTVNDATFKDPEPTYAGKNSFVGRYVLNGKIHIQSVYTGAELVIPPR